MLRVGDGRSLPVLIEQGDATLARCCHWTAFAGHRQIGDVPIKRPAHIGHGLQLQAGPERVESGWWDGGDVRRDYYRVATGEGQQAWAFRPAGSSEGPLMLQGWFA